jgi:hypothetical protein
MDRSINDVIECNFRDAIGEWKISDSIPCYTSKFPPQGKLGVAVEIEEDPLVINKKIVINTHYSPSELAVLSIDRIRPITYSLVEKINDILKNAKCYASPEIKLTSLVNGRNVNLGNINFAFYDCLVSDTHESTVKIVCYLGTIENKEGN